MRQIYGSTGNTWIQRFRLGTSMCKGEKKSKTVLFIQSKVTINCKLIFLKVRSSSFHELQADWSKQERLTNLRHVGVFVCVCLESDSGMTE